MSHSPKRPRVIWRLVEESLSEAAFLWLRMDGALDAHDHALSDVERWVEGRLQAALDGVRVAGTAAIEPLLAAALQDVDLGAVASAAYVLATLADVEADRALEQGLRQASPERVPALAMGLGRAAQTQQLHDLWSRLNDAPATARAAVLEALTFCGEAPAAHWRGLLGAADLTLQRSAAAALRYLPAAERTDVIALALSSPDTEVRNRATIAGIAARDTQAWQACTARVSRADRDCGPLLGLAASLGSVREQAHVIEALGMPELQRDALWALGFAGTRAAIEACVTQLRTQPHAAMAAEALAAITGLDLAGASHREENAAQEDDDSPSEAKDRRLPNPDVDAIETWWNSHRAGFTAGRYYAGKLATLDVFREALEHGPTRRRHVLAMEIAVRSRGACGLQTLGFCSLQRQQLGKLAGVSLADLREPAF